MPTAYVSLINAAAGGGLLAHWYEIAGIILAVPVACVVVWKMLAFFGHVQGVHEAIVGKPATSYSEKKPSMIERFKVTNEGVAAATEMARAAAELAADTCNEFHANGGATMRDSLDRNEKITADTGKEVSELAKRLETHVVDDSRIWNELAEALVGLSRGQDTAARDRVHVAATAVKVAADVAQTAKDAAAGVAQTAVDTAEGVAKTVVDVADELHRTGP